MIDVNAMVAMVVMVDGHVTQTQTQSMMMVLALLVVAADRRSVRLLLMHYAIGCANLNSIPFGRLYQHISTVASTAVVHSRTAQGPLASLSQVGLWSTQTLC